MKSRDSRLPMLLLRQSRIQALDHRTLGTAGVIQRVIQGIEQMLKTNSLTKP
jgi:hypothetical protein